MLEGERIQDRGHIVELDAGIFNLTNAISVVPTETAITTALTADPTLVTMAGTFAANDPDTKGVKTRKICPVPYSLTGLWLRDEDVVTRQ